MNKNVVFTVVIPLLEVVNTSLIAISTPLNKTNFYSELTSLRDQNGKKVFKTIYINLACEKCDLAKKRNPNAKYKKCSHQQDKLPPWKDPEMHETVNLVYNQMNKGNIGDQESKGIVGGDHDLAFHNDYIERLEKKAMHHRRHSPDWIIISCDPNGGGTSSDTSIVSAYYYEGKMVICGMELRATEKDDKGPLLGSHIMSLRSIKRFKSSWIVFIPENNLDDAARVLINEARKYERVHIYAEGDKTEGVKTVTGSKVLYTVSAEVLLASNAISFDPDFVCSNPWEKPSDRVNNVKTEFFRQLRQWKKITKLPNTAHGKISITYSGKTNDQNVIVVGQKDDATMAFIINTYYSSIIHRTAHSLFGTL